MKKLSVIALLTSIMIMAASAFCFADGGFDLTSSYPEDGQTNTSMENLGVKLTFSKPLNSEEAKKVNADKLAIYDEDGKAIPVQILFSDKDDGLVVPDDGPLKLPERPIPRVARKEPMIRTSSQKAKISSAKSSSPLSSSPLASPSGDESNFPRHKRTVSEMVHEKPQRVVDEEDWGGDFGGSDNGKLVLHVTEEDVAGSFLDNLPDFGASSSSKSTPQDGKSKTLAKAQLMSAGGMSTLHYPLPMRGLVQRIGNGKTVTEIADDADWVISGKKAGECVQLQAKPMRDLDVDDVDNLENVAEEDEDFWGDDKEEDEESENRRNENTELERRLTTIFQSILGNSPNLPAYNTLVDLLKEGTAQIEKHAQNVDAVFHQLGYAAVVDLFNMLECLSQTVSANEKKQLSCCLKEALHFLEKTFACTGKSLDTVSSSMVTVTSSLETMFNEANGFQVLQSYANSGRASQDELHIFAEFFGGLSTNALLVFVGCGGMVALARLLRDLDKNDYSGLIVVLDTVTKVLSLDDKKPNSDLRRSSIRANVHNCALLVAKAHCSSGDENSVIICNKVGQILHSLSRRDDSYTRRVLTAHDTVTIMLELLKTPVVKCVKTTDSKEEKQTLHRDLVKCMRCVCVSDAFNAKNLAGAGAIKVLVDLYPDNSDLQVHILTILSRCCKFDKGCTEEAVNEGIIPHLLKTGQDRVLKDDTVSLFTAMTLNAFARKKMLECGVLAYFVDLLHDRFFLDSALIALENWAKKEKKIAHQLAAPQTVKSMTWAVENGCNEQVLENYKNLLLRSRTLTNAVVKDGDVVRVLLAKLKAPSTKPNVKLNALVVLRRICSKDKSGTLASKYKLVSELSNLRKEFSNCGQATAFTKIDEILGLLRARTPNK